MRILIFGDSITQGFFDVEGGWVGRLRQNFDQQIESGIDEDPPTVFNLGVSGDSSEDLLKRLENEVKARQWPGEELVIVLNIGVNDSRIDDEKPLSDIETFKSNVGRLIEISKKYAAKVVLVGLTPCVEERTNPVKWETTPIFWNNQRIDLFNDELIRITNQHGVHFIPILDVFRAENDLLNVLPDGLHPNSKGHEFIYNIVRPVIEKIIVP